MRSGLEIEAAGAMARGAVHAPSPAASAPLARLLDLWALTKPRITLMVMFTAVAGAWLGARGGGAAAVGWRQLAGGLVGIALVVAAANVLNMHRERRIDGLMARTASRPLPAGRLAPVTALRLGWALCAAATWLLAAAIGPLAAAVGLAALVLYVEAYTPLKRVTPHALWVGALSGATPPVLGWAAATGRIALPALGLGLVLFLWQLPHFLAIGSFRAAEYERAGLAISASELGPARLRRRALGQIVALGAATLSLAALGQGGTGYAALATLLAAALFAVAARSADRVERWARHLFLGTLVYLVALFALLGAMACAR